MPAMVAILTACHCLQFTAQLHLADNLLERQEKNELSKEGARQETKTIWSFAAG
jgi:hypothetical protein